ncbi:hypothetical protein LTR84_008724 [Exophiala bonariae]|uniref:Uncharacterized protein n=1 Tax=Exophiala bonariae TaxID=1690606 RepID=A0AAV9MWJ5_9EURO|nr:hypothetical protein LTR84_008724 [Exophiala bonariae]
MAEMRWTDRYNATAVGYAISNVVKAWYADIGPYPGGDSDDVKALSFNKLTTTTSSSAGPATSSAEAPTTYDLNNQTGLLVGSIIGVLVVIALLSSAMFFSYRRSKHRGTASKTTTASGTLPDWPHVKAELPMDARKTSMQPTVEDCCHHPSMDAI